VVKAELVLTLRIYKGMDRPLNYELDPGKNWQIRRSSGKRLGCPLPISERVDALSYALQCLISWALGPQQGENRL
jgi:hypothetical protein